MLTHRTIHCLALTNCSRTRPFRDKTNGNRDRELYASRWLYILLRHTRAFPSFLPSSIVNFIGSYEGNCAVLNERVALVHLGGSFHYITCDPPTRAPLCICYRWIFVCFGLQKVAWKTRDSTAVVNLCVLQQQQDKYRQSQQQQQQPRDSIRSI